MPIALSRKLKEVYQNEGASSSFFKLLPQEDCLVSDLMLDWIAGPERECFDCINNHRSYRTPKAIAAEVGIA